MQAPMMRSTNAGMVSRLTPSPLSRAAETDIAILLNAEHAGQIPAKAALPAATRKALQDRLASLESYLAPASRDEIMSGLLRVFMSLSAKSDDGVDAQTRALVYCDILRDLPPFAVRKACDDFCSGRAGDRKWAPTAAELKSVAQMHAAPLKRDMERIKRALAARVVDEAVDYRAKQRALDHARETMRLLGAALPINEHGRVELIRTQNAHAAE